MNHKRKRPKNRRAGRLSSKPWKLNNSKPSDSLDPQEKRAIAGEGDDNYGKKKRKKGPSPVRKKIVCPNCSYFLGWDWNREDASSFSKDWRKHYEYRDQLREKCPNCRERARKYK